MGFRDWMGGIRDAFVEQWVEDKFKAWVYVLCKTFTPAHLQYLIDANVGLFDALEAMGHKHTEVEPNEHTEYLASLEDDYVLDLLAEVAPEHVAILRQYPEYTKSVCQDLRRLARGEV